MSRVNKKFANAFQNAQAVFRSPAYKDLNRSFTHDRLVKMAKSGTEASEEMLSHIRDRISMRLCAQSRTMEEFCTKNDYFQDVIWLLLHEEAKPNTGTAHFLLENATNSDYVAKFFYNIRNCLAKAVLPATGVTDSLMGHPEVVPETDPMFPYIYDQSYRMIQDRIVTAQNELKKLKGQKIFFAGGGLLPELWTNNYPLGEIGQTFVVYDTDPTLPAYLEEILGDKLESFGIDYRCGDFREVRANDQHKAEYAAVVANGFMSYSIVQNEKGYDATNFTEYTKIFDWLLAPGGKYCFDLQLFHPVLIFDLLVLYWPKGMCTIKDFQVAQKLITPILESCGFKKNSFSHEPVRYDLGEQEAGIYTVATKIE